MEAATEVTGTMIALRFLAFGMVVAAGAGLAACSSGPSLDPGTLMTGGRDPAAEQAALARYAPVAVCPPVQVRDGTQLLRVYEAGKQGDMSAIRFQGTIQKFARECHTDPATGITTVKVGVAGRLLSGRSGATGSASLPMRVVLVKDGDTVLYSQLHKVDTGIAAGESAVTWTKIVDDISIPPAPGTNYVIYVGFDEGPAKS